MKVVIVESPAKAKTINKYLGKDFEVLASFGHVRDLPSKDGSVDPEQNFDMKWEVDADARKRMTEITRAVKNADELILATDPDREGEAISWHVMEVLKEKRALKDKPVKRVVFNAITRSAVLEAMTSPRDLDAPLVDAYLARRALDYLVGFTLSPVLWRKLPGSRSAGRVQSVALRLVCARETEIEKFKPQEYWNIKPEFKKDGKIFDARLHMLDGNRIDRHDIKTREEALAIKTAIESEQIAVANVERKPTKRNPYPPFTTSTLQQDASSRLGFAPSRSMQVAQRLYEEGLITYMRTDGVQIVPEAIQAIRTQIKTRFDNSYVPDKARNYQSKAKNAQEAHEAIRPTDPGREPEQLKNLDPDQFRLYDLIWKRTMASQMRAAEIERTTADLNVSGARGILLRAVGSVITFPGFMALYGVGTAQKDDEGSKELPKLATGDQPTLNTVVAEQLFTQPPSRYTEASLIKKMEELGIGRPSTFASTLAVLQDRDYVRLEKRAMIAQDRGRLVTAFLESFFERYVEYDFTASLEEQLDEISDGKIKYKDVLDKFWRDFSAHVNEIKDLRVSKVLDALNTLLGDHIFPQREDGVDPRKCPDCETGMLSLKLGRYGAFIGCENYPECGHTRQLAESATGQVQTKTQPSIVGQHPESGADIELKSGRFGPYLEMRLEDGKKRAGLPKDWPPESIDQERAIKLINLPREIGNHPEDGKMITAGLGRFGPFLLHNGQYANLPDMEEVFSVGLNRAVAILADKSAHGKRSNRPTTLRDLGAHPDGGPVAIKDGRFGPYVTHGKVNATLPRDCDPKDVTLEQALQLIAAKAARGPAKKRKTTARKKKSPTARESS